MTTTSKIKTAIETITEVILEGTNVMDKVTVSAGNVSKSLADLETNFAQIIETIQTEYKTDNAFEAYKKAELEKLITEYKALKEKADQVVGI